MDIKEETRSRIEDVSSQAASQVSSTAEDLRARASAAAGDLRDQLGDAVEPLADSLQAAAERQKKSSADRLSGVARAISNAADEIDDQLPQAAAYIRDAAARVDHVSTIVRERSLTDLLHETERFARDNPVLFLGLSVLAGLALSRFLKSSHPSSNAAHERHDM